MVEGFRNVAPVAVPLVAYLVLASVSCELSYLLITGLCAR